MSTTTASPIASLTIVALGMATSAAMAQVVSPVSPTDFTPVIVAVVGGVFSVIGIVVTALVNARMKDTQAAATLNSAIGNALGAMQNAADAGLKSHPLQAVIPGISPELATGVQYALDHAGDEAARFGVTPAAIADKINARAGLVKITAPVVAGVKP